MLSLIRERDKGRKKYRKKDYREREEEKREIEDLFHFIQSSFMFGLKRERQEERGIENKTKERKLLSI